MFETIQGHIQSQALWYIFTFTSIGVMLLCIAIVMMLFLMWEYYHAISVDIIVRDVEEKTIKNDEDKIERGESETYIMYRPHFEITSGAYIGKSAFSSLSSSVNNHKVGEKMKGHYLPKSERIESQKTRNGSYILLSGFAGVGAFCAFAIPAIMTSAFLAG